MNPAEFLEKPNPFQLSVSIWKNTMGTWFKVVISPYQMKKSKSSLFSSERIKGGLTTRRGAGHKNTRKVKLPVMFWLGLFNCLLDVGLQFWNRVISRTFSISPTKMDFYNKASFALLQLCVFFLWKCSFCLVFYFQTRFASKLLRKSLCSTKRKNNNFVILTIFLC